jgi:CysZ protein
VAALAWLHWHSRPGADIRPETVIVTTVHDLQVVDEPIPDSSHDFRVDFIVTPTQRGSAPGWAREGRYAPGVVRRGGTAMHPAREVAAGVGLLARGMRMCVREPGLLLLGLIPAVISSLLLVAALVVVIDFIGPETRAVTWFARDWSDGARGVVEALAGIAIVGVAALLAIVGYTGLTLAIGDPFYEKISQRVEADLGGVPDAVELPWWRELVRSGGDALRVMVFAACVGLLLFVAGFLPAVGQTVVPVIGAFVGGWALAIELTGAPFARRGMRLQQRLRVLRQHRCLVLGFGTAVFVCFLIPLGAIIVMPAAVAGATVLTRRVLGLPS